MLSAKFINAVKLYSDRRYRLAQTAGVDASLLSRWINKITPVKDGDERVLRIARILGVKRVDVFVSDLVPAARKKHGEQTC